MIKKDCETCFFEEPCVLCIYKNKENYLGKLKPLKFYSVEMSESAADRHRDLHIKI